MKRLDKIKSSVLSRSLAMTKLTVNTGAKAMGHGLTQLFTKLEDKDSRWAEFLKNQAQSLSTELGQLKGSVMKAGQMISMYGELFLPPEANEFLKTLQSQSPPLQYSEIKKIILANLGPDKMALLEIGEDPIGTASLGQVHPATIKATGEQIALKVQYPGVDKAIQSDLKAIRSLLKMMKLLPGDFQTDTLFQEVQGMLEQEVDYHREAQMTIEYGKQFGKDPRFIVPKVYLEFSGPKILATSLERGLSPDDPLVKNLSAERRNRLSMNFLDLYFQELFKEGLVQTDPHLGNYKVRLQPDGQDQLVLLDFGAVRQYDPEFLAAYKRMIRGALLRDAKELEKASLDLKFIEESDSAELKKMFEDFCLMTVEPFLDPKDPHLPPGLMNASGEYDWKKSDLPKRLTQKALQIIRGFPLRTPPREVVFLDRKTGGVFIFLNVLSAQVRARELILKYLS